MISGGQKPTDPRPNWNIDRYNKFLEVALSGACVLCLAACCLIILVSVFFRYVLNDSLVWSEEVARWFLMGTAFLGAALAYRRGAHIGLSYFLDRLDGGAAAIARSAVALVIATFAAALCWVEAAEFMPLRAAITLPGSGFSQALFSLPVIAGAATICISALIESCRGGLRAWCLAALLVAIVAALYLVLGREFLAATRISPLVPTWALFAALLLLGVPTAFAMGMAGLGYFLLAPDTPLFSLAQQVESGVDSVALLSIPLFILTGKLQEMTSAADRLLDFVRVFLGKIRGGTALVTIGGMYLFSGISGSPTADLSAIGSVMIPALRRQGFSQGDAVGLISASAVMGHTIPPSIAIIVLAQIAGLSVGALFAAGVVPATLLAIILAAFVLIRAKRQNLPPDPPLTLRERGKFFRRGLPALSVPVLLFGGIFSGIVTPTEVGALAVLLSIGLGLILRELTWPTLVKALIDAASLTGMAMLLLATANTLAFASVEQELPQKLAQLVAGVAASQWQFLILSLVLLIAVGSILEFPALLIFGPLLIPIAASLGFNPIHYSIFLINALLIGSFMPPVGVLFYVTCGIAAAPVEKAMKESLLYLSIVAAGMLFIGFVPALVLWLPHLLGIMR
jgi:tripartite ATP-independent transporter DctM subunit